MAEFTIEFRGVCTHLIPQHRMPGVIRFSLQDGDVLHRVVIPNSKLIPDHVDPTRCVPPHIPKLIVPADAASDELRQVMMARSDNTYELVLDQVAISFENVEKNQPPDHWTALHDLPHIWEKAWLRNPWLHRSVQNGWDDHASAYIDFTTGVAFSVKEPKTNPIVTATLKTAENPFIVFRVRNSDPPTRYPLKGCKRPLIVSNRPVAECGNSDYLLNYLITTLSVCEDAPVWQPPAKNTYDVGTEVYCGSTGYP